MGGAVFGIVVAAIAIISYIRYRRVIRSHPPAYGSGNAIEIAAKEVQHVGPDMQEPPQQDVMELQSNALQELPEDHTRREVGPKSPQVGPHKLPEDR